MKKQVNKNPFASADGAPVEGKEKEFFEWERQRDIKRLRKLTKQQNSADIKAQKELNKRMQS